MLCVHVVHVFNCAAMTLMCNVFISVSLSAFDMSFRVYFCMLPVCLLCCFIVIPMDLVSELNDDDDDDDDDLSTRSKTKQGNSTSMQ